MLEKMLVDDSRQQKMTAGPRQQTFGDIAAVMQMLTDTQSVTHAHRMRSADEELRCYKMYAILMFIVENIVPTGEGTSVYTKHVIVAQNASNTCVVDTDGLPALT